MYQPIARAERRLPRQLRAYELSLKFNAFHQTALFPPDLEFCARFNDLYMTCVMELDALGLFGSPREPRLVQHYGLNVPLMAFQDQEPDRSVPDNPALCYLQYFEGKRILLVTSPAELLAERAKRDVFEAVWRKTGKRWFHPASIEALAFPYGWAPETRQRYGDSIRLLENVAEQMAGRDFDVALIAASGLGIPLAVQAKRLGKIGISLGGHLQALFGVVGRRWREREDWARDYITPDWIDMPDPRAGWSVTGADGGAYW